MPLDPKKIVFLRNGALLIAALFAVPFGYQRIRQLLAEDAFRALRASAGAPDSQFAIQLKDVDLRHYRGSKLVAQAHAGAADIMRSRQHFDLYDVTDGTYIPESGDPIKFAANQSVYDEPTGAFTANGGVRAQGKDFDLRTDQIEFHNAINTLVAPKPISGQLFNGQLQALTFTYNSKTGGFLAGPADWNGLVKLRVQDAQVDETPTQWHIVAEKEVYDGNDTKIMHCTDATATDGEVIVKAPKVDLDRKTDVITATGNVLYFAPEADLVADKVVVYRKEKRALLTGHVRMLIKPEDQKDQPAKVEPIPDFPYLDPAKVKVSVGPMTPEEKKKIEDLRSSDNLRKYPSKVAADSIEYWYAKGSRHAHITGNPQARQDFDDASWRHAWANEGFYDGEAETLKLVSGKGDDDWARSMNSGSDDLMAKEFLVHTKKDDERFEATKVKSSLISTEEDVDRKKNNTNGATKPTTPPPATTGGGTGTTTTTTGGGTTGATTTGTTTTGSTATGGTGGSTAGATHL